MIEAPVKVDETSRPRRRGGFAMPRLARFILSVFPRAVGAVLLLAASLKVWDERGVRRVLEFDGVPESLLGAAVSAVIVTESAVGLLLILRPRLTWVLDAGVILLSLYTLQLAYLAAFSDAPGCACFTAWQAYRSARFDNLLGIGRNVCLTLALLWVRAQSGITHTSSTSSASH